MDAGEIRSKIRSAVYNRNGETLLGMLADEGWPQDALQLIGGGLMDALRSGVQAAERPARRCAAQLRDRDWRGDDILADALEARLDLGPVPLLRPVPISLDDLTLALEGDGFITGGRIDLATGEFLPEIDGSDDFIEDEERDEGEWLWVEGQGSRDGYRDMEAFIARIDDPTIADRLELAIEGRHPFRRFKDTLARWPDLLQTWFSFSEDHQLGRARAWLADQGFTPARR